VSDNFSDFSDFFSVFSRFSVLYSRMAVSWFLQAKLAKFLEQMLLSGFFCCIFAKKLGRVVAAQLLF